VFDRLLRRAAPRDRAIAEQHEQEPARGAGISEHSRSIDVCGVNLGVHEKPARTPIGTLYDPGVVHEVRQDKVVWKLDGLSCPSDADRLPNGNTLVAAAGRYANTTGKEGRLDLRRPAGHRSKPLLCAMTQDRGPAVLLSVRRPSAGGHC